MKSQAHAEQTDIELILNLFCVPEKEAWRVYVRPTWLPRYLRDLFDEHGEAFPVFLDFDDLDRHMAAREMPFEKRVSRIGAIELTANGEAATALAVWLSSAFGTGIREASRASVPDVG